jgi:hypothetical protein
MSMSRGGVSGRAAFGIAVSATGHAAKELEQLPARPMLLEDLAGTRLAQGVPLPTSGVGLRRRQRRR